MSDYYASKVIAYAKSQIGYHEKASNAQLEDNTANSGDQNWNKYAAYIDKNFPDFYNYPKNIGIRGEWCDIFVDACMLHSFGEAGALYVTCQPKKSAGAGCYYSAQYYKQANRWFTSSPKVGDQIFFGDYDHTGLIVDIAGGVITTVEGNKNNQVAECKYVVNHPYIKGFGRPRYDAEPKTETPTPTTKPAEQKPAAVTEYKIKSGDTLSGIAEKYKTTVDELVKLNGIQNPNLIIAGQTLKIPTAEAGPKTYTYKIQPGDTLTAIAKKYGTTVSAIVKENGIKNKNLIIAGDTLSITV